MKKVCVVTGSRAEYGLLYPLLGALKAHPGITLQVLACGMHLSSRFGSTYREIIGDGFRLDARVSIPFYGGRSGVAKSIGSALPGFAAAFDSLSPDMVILLGDRFEVFAAAIAAFCAKMPIAHIHGGELTEGALDDAFRHSITKMAFLHFASCEAYRRRIVQLGEHPSRVFNVGALAIDNILHTALLSREELEKDLRFSLGERLALATFHPVTLESAGSARQLRELLGALDTLDRTQVIFTLPNADPGNGEIKRLIGQYVKKHPGRAKAFASLGRIKYLSAMRHADVVVGNSSSGLIEAPFFGLPTVNIGDRQRGRIRAESVIDCAPVGQSIASALRKALSPRFRASCKKIKNPYGSGRAAERITETIYSRIGKIADIKKQFYNLSRHVQK
ncbi:MAG: UDP-N-acetylglucosamine 2-epimerase [Candidatus Omnitrophota bacterium]